MPRGHLKLTCFNMSLPKKLVCLLNDDCHLLFKNVIPNIISVIVTTVFINPLWASACPRVLFSEDLMMSVG